MHLTNYSINKNSSKFTSNDEGTAGTKRSIKSVMEQLRKEGHQVDHLWDGVAVNSSVCIYIDLIQDLIIKTMISIQPHLSHLYGTCFPNDAYGNAMFEILGF